MYLLGSKIITARISGHASVVVLVEGDLLLYQSGAPLTVKNLRPLLQRQLHSFFFVFEHTLILMLCHQLRDNKATSTENFTAKSSASLPRQGGSSSRIMGEYSRRYTPSSTEDFTATSSCTSYSDPFQDKGGRIVVVPVK